MTMLQGVVRGKTIELETEPGLPDGQSVSVEIRALAAKPVAAKSPSPVPWWLSHLDVDPTVQPGKFVVKGTRVLADALVEEMEAGQIDQQLLKTHPDLSPQDVAAVREYRKVPLAMRRSFGAWADETEEFDRYIEWSRQRRKVSRQGLVE
jgi:uncharacterized protein (DUF433 family)